MRPSARDRVAETLSKLDVEADDVRDRDGCGSKRNGGRGGRRPGRARAIEATRIARRRANRSSRARGLSTSGGRGRCAPESMNSRALKRGCKSLEELESARAAYGDAPRAVLAHANGKVNQHGAIADYLEVEAGYERAVEACLGDLLQHVVVEHPEHAAAGFEVVRAAGVGRCGFLIVSGRALKVAPFGRRRACPELVGPT